MRTFKERLTAGLIYLGWSEDQTDRSRYTAFTKPGQPKKVFVGPAGALRAGKSASKSYSIGDPSLQTKDYKDILAIGDKVISQL